MPSTPIRPAAGVLLTRESAQGLQIYLLHRTGRTAFLPGFHCFPGGATEEGDDRVPVAAPADRPELVVAAARELFEETGVLLVDGPPPPAAELEEARGRLLDGQPVFADLLLRHGLRVDGSRLRRAGVRVTPPYSPLRFRARFFLATAREGDDPQPAPGEFAGGEWWTVATALRAWAAGAILLVPPTLDALLRLDRYGLPAALDSLEGSPEGDGLEGPALPLAPGLFYVPLQTRSLPPATHTLCILVGGQRMLIVDPGSGDPHELGQVFDAVQALRAEGRPPLEIVLTHHHPDHVAGASALAETLGLPVAAHAETARRLSFPVDRLVEDGDEWDLGQDPTGHRWGLRALHTPGHAPGHLCLWDEGHRFLIAGDMVAGVGTVVIDPPDGDLALYLSSLRRLRDLDPRLVLAAHGAPLGPGSDVFGRYLEHRLWRERRVLAALPGTEADLVARVYQDVPAALHPLAARSLLAHLLKLEAEGRAERREGAWGPPPSAGGDGCEGPVGGPGSGSEGGPR